MTIQRPYDEGDIEAFLAILQKLERDNASSTALDTLFEEVNAHLMEGHFEYCSLMLSQVNVEKFSPQLLIGFLTITCTAKEKIPAYHNLYTRINEHFTILFQDDPTRCTRILKGLKG